MAKITVDPGSLRKKQPGGEHITRIMYDDNEPPKNYIWGKPDGFLYRWNGDKWERLNAHPNESIPDFKPNGQGEIAPSVGDRYVKRSDLDSRLKQLKTELVAYFSKVLDLRDCPEATGITIEWINQNIIPLIRGLQEIDHSVFVTRDELEAALGNIDFGDLVTKEELADAVADLISSSVITNINNSITNINTQIQNITTDLQNSERVTSAALNDLNDRLSNVENYDYSQFITAEEITHPISIYL